MIWATMGVNTWCNANSVSFKSHSIRVTFKICTVLCSQGICATGFRHAQGNQHCAKFESYTNRVTFETNAISITSSIHALNLSTYLYMQLNQGLAILKLQVQCTYGAQSQCEKNPRFFSLTMQRRFLIFNAF